MTTFADWPEKVRIARQAREAGREARKGKPVTLDVVRPESYTISVRLNAEEPRILTEAARARGMKLSTYVKEMAMQQSRPPRVIVRHEWRAETWTR